MLRLPGASEPCDLQSVTESLLAGAIGVCSTGIVWMGRQRGRPHFSLYARMGF